MGGWQGPNGQQGIHEKMLDKREEVKQTLIWATQGS